MIKAIADKRGRTPAQVALRFQLQRGLVVLAKSFNEQRMRENLQVRGRGGRRARGGEACPLAGSVHASRTQPAFNSPTPGPRRSRWLCKSPLDSFSCKMKDGLE